MAEESKREITLKEVQKIVPEAVGSFREKGLVFGEFQEDFESPDLGGHKRYGLWTNEGDWLYAFDTLKELAGQVEEDCLPEED